MHALDASLIVATLALAACAGDGATTDQESARSAATQLATISTEMDRSSATAVKSAVKTMLRATMGIVEGDTEPNVLETSRTAAGTQQVSGVAMCSPTGCTFSSYGDEGDVIDGSIVKNGSALTFALTYEILWNHDDLWSLDGTASVTATSLDGELRVSGSTLDPDFVLEQWDVTAEYKLVGLDTGSCPTTGSVHAASVYSIAAEGHHHGYDVDGTVTFDGTGCSR